MEQPKVQVFSRSGAPGDSSQPPKPTEAKSSLSWRKISLLGTPLLLGVINLIEAHWEKRTAFTNGEIRYSQLIGEGKEAERVALEQGRTVGLKRKEGMINEAKLHAKGVVTGAESVADFEREVGVIKAPVIDIAALRTKALMKPLHDITENILHITRLALLKNEGLIISVPSNLMETAFVGHGEKGVSNPELRRRIDDIGRLVEVAAVARTGDSISSTGKPKFLGCR